MNNISDLSNKIYELINDADAIVVGIGNGLTAEGGVSFEDEKILKAWFPEYEQLGFNTVRDLLRHYKWFDPNNMVEFWSFWAQFIQKLRYNTNVLKPYEHLYDILKDRNYFIVTSTFDAQIIKAGFNMDKVFTPDGDLAYFQCSRPCTYDIYYNEKEISKMCNHLSHEDKVRQDLLPICPKCGDYLIPNVRTDENFTAEPYLKNIRDYDKFLSNNLNNKVLFLELGEGYENPMIIRYPFENMVERISSSHLVRFNTTEFEVPLDIEHKCITVSHSIGEVLENISILNKDN